MFALGELGSTAVLLLVTYPLAVFLSWINGAEFRTSPRRPDRR